MSWPWQRSIQTRIVALIGGLLCSVLLVVNVGMAYFLARSELEETAHHLQIQGLVAASSLQDPLSSYSGEFQHLADAEDEDDDDDDDDDDDHDHHHDERKERIPTSGASLLSGWATSLSQRTGASVLVSFLDGKILAGEGPTPTRSELESARQGEPLHRWSGTTIFASVPVIGRQGRPIGLIRLAVPRGRATARSAAMSLTLILASLTALTLALLAAVGLSRRLIRPLRQLEARANEAARGNSSTQIDVTGSDELASLSRAFAHMLAELQSTLERQRLFVSHASHELRNPLTRIKLRTEALASGALQDSEVAERFVKELDSEVDRLTRLTDSLLDLARLEERGSAGVRDPLEALIAALDRVRPLAARRRLQLLDQLPQALPPLTISDEALDTVLNNLLDNALKYTPEGGLISLKAEAVSDGVELTVSDSGPGIPPEHLPHVFERFYRVDSTRGSQGFGLGLALVKAAVDASGGQVRAVCPLEGGTQFVVRLNRTSA